MFFITQIFFVAWYYTFHVNFHVFTAHFLAQNFKNNVLTTQENQPLYVYTVCANKLQKRRKKGRKWFTSFGNFKSWFDNGIELTWRGSIINRATLFSFYVAREPLCGFTSDLSFRVSTESCNMWILQCACSSVILLLIDFTLYYSQSTWHYQSILAE